jgi:hypothetical protein
LEGVEVTSSEGHGLGRFEAQFGRATDEILAAKNLTLDEESRCRVLGYITKAFESAASELKNTRVSQQPQTATTRPDQTSEGDALQTDLTLSGLFAAWEQHAMRLKRTGLTIRRYRTIFANLRDFLQHDTAGRITPDDLARFRDARLAEGISWLTLKKADLTCLKAVFGWAATTKRLRAILPRRITIRRNKSRQAGEGLHRSGSVKVLTAALRYTRPERGSVHLAAAKRWVPWLCAFTGAPITDVTGVRKEDFRREGEILVLRLFGTRSRSYRDVPIHPQLVELGFEQFLAGARAGPLFHKQKDLAARRQRPYPETWQVGALAWHGPRCTAKPGLATPLQHHRP